MNNAKQKKDILREKIKTQGLEVYNGGTQDNEGHYMESINVEGLNIPLLWYDTMMHVIKPDNSFEHIGAIKNTIRNKSYTESIRQEGEGGEKMDEGYKKLLDRQDQDIRDHKQEIAARDARLQNEMAEREARYHKESAEREERIISAIKDLKLDVTKSVTDTKELMKAELSEMKQSVIRSEGSISDTEKHIQTMVTQNHWGRVATVVTILAICATIGATLWAAVWSVSRNSVQQPTVKQSDVLKTP